MKKYRIVALLLNIFIGAGYIYIGKFKKAFFFAIVPTLILIIGTYLEQYIDFSLLFSVFIVIIIYLYSFVDIWRSFPTTSKDNATSRCSRWYCVLLFILLNVALQLFISQNRDLLPTQQFTLPTSSMNNTLYKGDYIVALKQKQLKRGDIAVFRNPRNPDIYYVKRVVATGGDEVIYQDKKLYIHFKDGDAYMQKHFPASHIRTIRNKRWVENPYLLSNPHIIYAPKQYSAFQILAVRENSMSRVYIETLPTGQIYQSDSGEKFNAFYKKVEQGHYFMTGDNRDNSNDSRFFGSVAPQYIYGIVKNIYFNYKTWNRFHIMEIQ